MAGKSEPQKTTPKRVSTNLFLAKDPERWRLRKLQILQRRMDQASPNQISLKDYLALLEEITTLMVKVQNRDTDKENLDRKVRSARSAGVRKEKRSSVDTGVLPEDLVAG